MFGSRIAFNAAKSQLLNIFRLCRDEFMHLRMPLIGRHFTCSRIPNNDRRTKSNGFSKFGNIHHTWNLSTFSNTRNFFGCMSLNLNNESNRNNYVGRKICRQLSTTTSKVVEELEPKGYNLALDRAAKIMINITERTVTSVLHMYCSHNFIKFLGENTHFDISGCSYNPLVVQNTKK